MINRIAECFFAILEYFLTPVEMIYYIITGKDIKWWWDDAN